MPQESLAQAIDRMITLHITSYQLAIEGQRHEYRHVIAHLRNRLWELEVTGEKKK